MDARKRPFDAHGHPMYPMLWTWLKKVLKHSLENRIAYLLCNMHANVWRNTLSLKAEIFYMFFPYYVFFIILGICTYHTYEIPTYQTYVLQIGIAHISCITTGKDNS